MCDSFNERNRYAEQSTMRAFVFLAAFFAAAFASSAETTNDFERFSPHLSTNTQIVWQASTNHLPKSLWTYQKILPHVFPASTISNAVILGALQYRGFPEPSTNNTCFEDDCHCSCMIHCLFSINPGYASMFFSSPLQTNTTQEIPGDEAVISWAWRYAERLGVDPAQVAFKDITFHFNTDTNDNKLPDQISGRGVFLARVIDSVQYIGNGNDGFASEGFWIEFGSYGLIRNFCLIWPDLKRIEQYPTASPQQIIACIQAHKAIVLPNDDEPNYFARVKNLAKAETFTITKVTPYYSEGVYGEMPTNDEPSNIVAPIAELEAVADFGNSNVTVRLLSPIISSEVNRSLGK